MPDEIEVGIKEPKTAEQVLKPIIYFSWLMGTGICRPDGHKRVTIFLKIFHFTMCSTVIAFGIKDYFTIGNVIHSEMYKIMYYTNKAVVYVTSYYFVIFGIFHYKKWQKFVERFDALDKKLRREISISDRSTKVHQIVVFCIAIVLGPVSIIAHVAYYYITDFPQLVGSDVLHYYTMVQTLITNFGFDIMVFRIYKRFKTVNGLIKQIGDTYAAPWIVLKIQRLKELHYGICSLVNILNKGHGLHLLLSSTNSFIMVVATLFRIYIGVVDSNFSFIMLNNVIWIVYAVQFVMNCYVCTLASREARRTGILIYQVGLKNNQLTNKRLYSNHAGNRRSLSYQPESKTYEGSSVQSEISFFASQLEQNPVAFSACEFFVINNALLQGFIGVITTYLIILIQFHHPADDDKMHSGVLSANISALDATEDYNYTTITEQNYNVLY